MPSIGKHHSARAGTEQWLTPPALIERLGPFDLDPCSLLPRPWPTARAHYYHPIDGLAAPWRGRVWLNPPYSSQIIGRWLQRLADHGVGTALIFARTETQPFFRQVWERATALLFLEGRLHFHYPDGSRARANGGAPSVLCAYGRLDADRLAGSELCGQFVPLLLPTIHFLGRPGRESWRQVIRTILESEGRPLRLAELYSLMAAHPLASGNRHWREKIRQTLQRGAGERVASGTWQRLPAAPGAA